MILKKVMNYFSNNLKIFGHMKISFTFFQQLDLLFLSLNRAYFFALKMLELKDFQWVITEMWSIEM